MAYEISLTIPKGIEVLHSDLVIIARQDGALLGTLTISKGTIDWRPKNRRAGKKGETQLTWSQFADRMQSTKTE
ncbi:hypothetical protein [Granulicella sp. L46]|uniref:hypothetical protein n=1 Tax=Granulicella sp. L46 TaxID=1641865 RepID=UPI00131C15C9|nr:hypothetical protein [Granulicella sp. L46]